MKFQISVVQWFLQKWIFDWKINQSQKIKISTNFSFTLMVVDDFSGSTFMSILAVQPRQVGTDAGCSCLRCMKTPSGQTCLGSQHMSGGESHMAQEWWQHQWQLQQQPQVQRHDNNGKTRMGDIESWLTWGAISGSIRLVTNDAVEVLMGLP